MRSVRNRCGLGCVRCSAKSSDIRRRVSREARPRRAWREKDETEYTEEVQQITELSDEFLRENGVGEEVLAKNVYEFLFSYQPVVLIAHNAQFDMLFILELLRRYDYSLHAVEYAILDTITVARDRKPFPHKLIDMMYHYNTHPDANFHRADVDVSVLIEVFYSMLHEKNDIHCYLDVIGIPPKKKLMGYCLPTIRYKIQPWFHYTHPRPPLYV